MHGGGGYSGGGGGYSSSESLSSLPQPINIKPSYVVPHAGSSVAMAKSAPMLSRGYTRAHARIFDSDDDTAVDELPVRTINHPAHSEWISPPPQRRVSSAAAPMTNAVASASMVQLSIRGQPKPPPTRPPVHMQPNTSHQPASAVSAPRPPKGGWRYMGHMQTPIAYVRPPISTGYDHVVDGAAWRCVEIKQKARMLWPSWGCGIVDLRPYSRAQMVAGKLLRHAMYEAHRIIRMTACEHKIGMCRCPHARFMFYQSVESSWQPWVMCLLGNTTTREGAFFLEASLIYEIERSSTNIDNNINWLKSCDYGGEGPRAAAEASEEHVVYLAVSPTAPSPQC